MSSAASSACCPRGSAPTSACGDCRDEWAASIAAAGGEARFWPCDAGDRASLEAAHQPLSRIAAYSAAKAAVVSVTRFLAHTPMGRFGDPEELVGAAVFLASPRASAFVTGAEIVVDGGFLATAI